MWAKEIESNIISVSTSITKLASNISEKRINLESAENSVNFVPEHVYKRFKELKENMTFYSNKKRKESEREIETIKKEYKMINEYAEKYMQLTDLERQYKEESDYFDYLSNLIESQVTKICSILLKEGLLVRSDLQSYMLTDSGKIAANMAEINPVLAAKIVEESAWFDGWNVANFATFFGCFTQIKVDEEYRRLAFQSNKSDILTILNSTKEHINKLEQFEQNIGAYTGICYEDMMTYDLIEEIGQWIECETEQQCKYFIQTVLAGRGISLGDFTKAVLKIATIAREFADVCDKFGKLSASHTLSKMDGSILKFVTTCQSLYI
jgi:hypothetical protein